MSDPKPKLYTNPNATLQSAPALAANTAKRFKLKATLPGTHLPSPWVCRMTGSALAYQNYVSLYGTPRIFTWETLSDGKTYLQDQEGYWLSWETTANCLYMSYKSNAAAWKIENGRLIRESDNAVVSWKTPQKWPLSDDTFLMALAPSPFALTIEIVEEPLGPIEALLDKLQPVFVKSHQAGNAGDVDRYMFSTNPAPITATRNGESRSNPNVNDYAKGQLAFFGLTGPASGEMTQPVYLLRRYAEQEGHTYFKLSTKTEEAGYAVDPKRKQQGPEFHAFDSRHERPHLTQVFEHSAETKTSGLKCYFYDFKPEAHDGWSTGTPAFRAITPERGKDELINHADSRNARAYAEKWFTEYGKGVVELFQKQGKTPPDRAFADQVQQQLKGLPETRYMSMGAGMHLGYGIGTAGFEGGSIWAAEDFGHTPMRTPLADYTLEWVTFGVAGVDLGGSADALVLSHWFGELSQVEGGCNGITFSGQFGAGISVTLVWDGRWQGVNGTTHPIGVTVVAAVGLEAGLGVFYNASATQIFNRRPAYPK